MNIRAILRYTEKNSHSFALPNIKYNCVEIDFTFRHMLVVCACFQTYFLIDQHCITRSEWTKMLKYSQNFPNFPQGVHEVGTMNL